MSDPISLSRDTGAISNNNIDDNIKSGEISSDSKLHGEVKHASKGARAFFYHPATIAIFTVLTGGLYGIGIGLHALFSKSGKTSSDTNTVSGNNVIENKNKTDEVNKNTIDNRTSELKKVSVNKLTPESTAIPKITCKKDLISYLKICCAPNHTVNGKVEEIGTATDSEGKEAKLFGFKGIVFRGDKRPPNEILKAGGFKSQQDLNDGKNLQEAQGLGESKGATGKSGVSCAQEFYGATGYFNNYNPNGDDTSPYLEDHKDGGRLYIIDTTKLDPEDKTYSMKDIVIENKYKKDDETGGEINVTSVPKKAIIGWIRFDYYTPNDMYPGDKDGQKKFLNNLLDKDYYRHKDIHIEFNSRYKP